MEDAPDSSRQLDVQSVSRGVFRRAIRVRFCHAVRLTHVGDEMQVDVRKRVAGHV